MLWTPQAGPFLPLASDPEVWGCSLGTLNPPMTRACPRQTGLRDPHLLPSYLPRADNFLVLMILAAYSWPVQSFTQRRTTEKAPLRGSRAVTVLPTHGHRMRQGRPSPIPTQSCTTLFQPHPTSLPSPIPTQPSHACTLPCVHICSTHE